MMGDLLEYFEERARVLDSMAPTIQTSAAMCNPDFISCITFNGIPILPPVLTARRREEMQEYKRQAMRRNYQRKTRQREQMNARLSSLVKDVEEKNASRWTEVKQSEEQEVPTRDITPKTHQSKTVSSNSAEVSKVTKAKVERSSRPAEIKSKISSKARRGHRSGSQGSDDDVKSEMTVLVKTHRHRRSSEGEKDDPKSEPIKTKNKHRIPVPEKSRKNSGASRKTKPAPRGGNSIDTLRRSSSLSSLPNLAKIQGVNALSIPKPPSSQMTEQQQARQLSLRHYSNSQPDLRTLSAENITFSPPTRRSHSKDDINDLDNAGIVSMSREQSMSNPDLPQSSSSSDNHKATTGLQGGKSGKDSTLISGNIQDNKKDTKKNVDSKKLNVGAKSKVNSESEQKRQITSATKKQVEQTQNSSQTTSRSARTSEQSETSGSGTASADFPSLEGCNSLPHEIDGLRFTSVRQQHIGHTLDKLSKVLNMEETLSTLNSTSSNEIQENISRLRQSAQSSHVGYSTQSSVQSQQSFDHAGGRRGNTSPQTNLRNPTETPSPKTSDSSAPASTPSSAEQSFGSNTSGSSTASHSRVGSNTSGSSNASHSRVSAVSASTRSSASSVTGSQSGGVPSRRMSPKGLKNAVHFAPLVTEISTSASQSLEDKISVRKLDVTPTNSIQFDSGEQGQISRTGQEGSNLARNRTSDSGSVPPSVHVTIQSSESMLSKVALSPETDSPQTPNDGLINNMPFETYGQSVEGEINTSDKENELRTQPQGRSQIPGRYIDAGLRGPSRNMDQLLVKSQNSDDGSQTSTLKGSQDLLGERSSVRQEMDPQRATEYQSTDTVRNAIVHSQGQQTRSTNVNPRIAAQSQPVMGRSSDDTLRSTQESSHPAIRGKVPVNISGKSSYVSQQIYDLQQKSKQDVAQQQAPPILTRPVAHTHAGTFSQVPNTKAAERTVSRGSQRKLNMGAGTNVNCLPPKNVTGDSDGEREAKAEHIQKYLNHVQRHSLEADADSAEDSKRANVKKNSPSLQEPFDLRSTIQSFTSSLQSLNQTDEEELLRIQAEHFDKLRRHLIDQQKHQLEELFVHQRREQMVLQTDIEKYQSQLQEQEEFLSKNSPSTSYNNLPGTQQVPVAYGQSSQDPTHQLQPPDNKNIPSHFQSHHPSQSHYHIQTSSHPNTQSNSQTHSQSNSYSHPYSNSHSFSQSDSYSHPQSNSQANIQPNLPSQHQPQVHPQHQQPNPQQPNIPLQSNIPQQQPGPASQSYQQSYPYQEQYVQRTNPHPGYTQQQYTSYDTAYSTDRGSYPHGLSHASTKVLHPAQAQGQTQYVSQSNYHQPVDIQDPNYFRHPSTQHPPPDTLRHNHPPPPKYSQHDPRKLNGNPYELHNNGRDPRNPLSNPQGHNDQGESYQSPPRDDANTSHQYSYVPSPSLYYNPRDNGSDISTFSKATPKQSLTFNNHSTPTPKIHKPVLRSPIKQPSLAFSDQHVVVPELAYNANLKRCFDRVSACVRGYLTRRLLRTEKVQEILKTIKDTKDFAYQFQAETPIKRGDFSSSDRHLLDRIIAQLQAALLDVHEIFFEIPVWERMSLIAQSRQAQEEKRLRESTGTRSSVSSSHPRISSATLKAIERKRKQEEEVAVSADSRPRSAPPPVGNTAFPSSYGNVPSQVATQARINSQNNARPNAQVHATIMDQRALRPLPGQGQSSQTQGQTSRITTRPKERPQTAPNQTTGNTAPHPYLIAKSKKSSIPSFKDKQSNKITSNSKSASTSSTATTAAKNKPAGSKIKPKTTDKASKAWRGRMTIKGLKGLLLLPKIGRNININGGLSIKNFLPY
ncbi:hypothetical protein KP79_PYT06217 [Mizuhopecten yessoensis]|uniref:Centriolar coiled-coil protein of 110 kDa n=2 Tax=Mizuhopecten yessoensis TaxID=6573 RepID=A0A210QGA2_MIZYE|nr:hypothetical protein KP79_PYT06217 [Mizuhopecten yessoensis]